MQQPCPPAPSPGAQQPAQPGQPSTTTEGQGTTQTPETTGQTAQGAEPNQGLGGEQGAAGGGDTVSLGGEQGAAGGGSAVSFAAPGGYLDIPMPITTFRIRYDDAYNLNRPDRAAYIYGAWHELSVQPHGIQGPGHGIFFQPSAKGPDIIAPNVDYQQPSAYFELAAQNRVSVFLEAPYRYINFKDTSPPPPQTSFNGFSDLQFGFKYALLADPNQFLTFQLRGYSPTGSAGEGLGTGHWSVEPSLLLYERFNRLVLQAQLTDWVPIAGGVAGNVLSYGAGAGYAVFQRGNFVVMPITEFLGWTVLNGYESVSQPLNITQPTGLELPTTQGVAEAGGNTIINGKFGLRAFWGGQSLYVGYGRALTGTHWYTDIFRLEYRIFFGANRLNARAL
jgi:hypothetical protein